MQTTFGTFEEGKINTATVSVIYSSYAYLLSDFSKQTKEVFSNKNFDVSVFDDNPMEFDNIVNEINTVSFSSDSRLIIINMQEFSKIKDEDFSYFIEEIKSAAHIKIIILFRILDKRDIEAKKQKQIVELSQKNGYLKELFPLNEAQLNQYICETLKLNNTKIQPDVALSLARRFINSQNIVQTELQKLAAAASYNEITQEIIDESAGSIVAADVFKMTENIFKGQINAALSKLKDLLYLSQEPIAILGALCTNFIDIYKVKLAEKQSVNYSKAFKELRYKGNDYRLKMAKETGNRYSLHSIRKAIILLSELDIRLKSSVVSSSVLLEAYIIEISSILAGGKNH